MVGEAALALDSGKRPSAVPLPCALLFSLTPPLITPDRWIKEFTEAGFKPEVQPSILKENALRLLGLGKFAVPARSVLPG